MTRFVELNQFNNSNNSLKIDFNGQFHRFRLQSPLQCGSLKLKTPNSVSHSPSYSKMAD